MAAGLAERVADAVPAVRRLPGLGAVFGTSHRPPPPQPFSLTCPCGGKVVGTRGDRERTERCPACGEEHFVLPADVYPRPPEEVKPARSKKRAAADRADEPPDHPAVAKAAAVPAAERVPLKARLAAARAAALSGAKRQATPLRLIALGMLLVVAGTGWWAVRRSRAAAAKVALAEVPAELDAALAEARFPDAADAADELAAAFATLGRGDTPDAARARQTAREATAAAGLASRTPPEIAAQAAAVRTPAERTEWSRQFDALFRGRWVVLDTLAARVPPPVVRGLPGGVEEKRRRATPPRPRTGRNCCCRWWCPGCGSS